MIGETNPSEQMAPPIPHPTASSGIPPVLTGILLAVSAMLIIPFNDGIAKVLTARYPVAEIVWGRYVFHFLLLLPLILWKHGPRSLLPARAWLHMLRGAFTVSATFFFFWALKTLPMADTLALMFSYPFLITALSPWLLGEKVGPRRWAAVTLGMLGATIIIRPGTDVFQWSSLLGIAAALCMASYWIVTRRVSGSAPPLVGAAFAALTGIVAMPILLPAGWVMPNATDLLLMAAMGAIGATFHFLVVKALDFAPASVLAPLGYCEMINATLIGYLVFGDFPDALTWVGIAVVIAAGIYISVRERQAAEPAEQ